MGRDPQTKYVALHLATKHAETCMQYPEVVTWSCEHRPDFMAEAADANVQEEYDRSHEAIDKDWRRYIKTWRRRMACWLAEAHWSRLPANQDVNRPRWFADRCEYIRQHWRRFVPPTKLAIQWANQRPGDKLNERCQRRLAEGIRMLLSGAPTRPSVSGHESSTAPILQQVGEWCGCLNSPRSSAALPGSSSRCRPSRPATAGALLAWPRRCAA